MLRFDHHCTILNQCVGLRNNRAFVVCLLFTFTNFCFITITSLYYYISIAIIEKGVVQGSPPKVVQTKSIILYAIVITLISAKYLSLILCRNKLSFGTQVIWFAIEVPLVAILCLIDNLNFNLLLVSVMLCLGSTGSILVFQPLKLHLNLVSLGITLKEKIARINELQLH